MSRVRRYSRSGPTAQQPRSPTGLSPPTVTRSSGLRLKAADPARRLPPPPVHSSNPPQASPAGYAARGVWAPPRSLAATKGILSVPRGTEMFQFPRCPLRDRSQSARPCAGRVAPFGDPRIAGCQRLPGAFRRVAASFLGRQRLGIHHAPFSRRPTLRLTPPPSGASEISGPARATRTLPSHRRHRSDPHAAQCGWLGNQSLGQTCSCAVRAGERTPQRCFVPEAPSRVVSSAAAKPSGSRVAHCQGAGWQSTARVGAPGLEPGTSALSGPRSNHLSYAPVALPFCEQTRGERPAPETKRVIASSLPDER
jgi:hypothetical protein